MTDSPYTLLVLGLAFIAIGFSLFDDTLPRVLMIAGGGLFILEFARQRPKG